MGESRWESDGYGGKKWVEVPSTCQQNTYDNCRDVQKQKLVQVPYTDCQNVPQQQCQQVPEQQCQQEHYTASQQVCEEVLLPCLPPLRGRRAVEATVLAPRATSLCSPE